MKLLLSIFIVFFLFSCSHEQQRQERKDSDNYILRVSQMKSQIPQKEYRHFLMEEIQKKDQELLALKDLQIRESSNIEHHEISQTDQHQDLHAFAAQSGKIQMKRNDDKIKRVESELMFLKTKLSELN